MRQNPIIMAEGLWHVYPPNIVAIRGIDLKIYPGELIAIVGQNGGGKTTLVKHFNGLLKPTKGRVLVGGKDTKNASVNKLAFTVGYVFQNPRHQIFSSRVYDEVAFGPRNAGLAEDEVENRVKDALIRTGLQEHKETHPYDLDYGRMKLLTIASVIAMQPDVYVLDEPTSGQDHKGRNAVAGLVSNLNRESKTAIVITHDMKFVAQVAQRTILMADGKLMGDGPTRSILFNMEMLRNASIRPPQIAELCEGLKKFGLSFDALSVDEASEAFTKCLEGKPLTPGED